VRRLQAKELGEVPGRGEGEGSAGWLAVHEAEVLERLRVLVHLGTDHVEQIALQKRLMICDEGRRLQQIPLDLRWRERTGPLRELRPDLHRPFRPDLGDLDRASALRVLPREGSEVLPDGVRSQAGHPREFVRGQRFSRAEQRRLHDRPFVHGPASGGASGFGPRAGRANSSSVGRSASIESRLTKISPCGYSFCHSFTFSRWARNRRDMNTVTSSHASPRVSWCSAIGSPLNCVIRVQVRAMSSVRSSPWTFWWKFGANFRIACSRRAFSCIWISASRRASSKASISSIRVTARRPSRWIASVRGVADPARTT